MRSVLLATVALGLALAVPAYAADAPKAPPSFTKKISLMKDWGPKVSRPRAQGLQVAWICTLDSGDWCHWNAPSGVGQNCYCCSSGGGVCLQGTVTGRS